MNDVNFTYGTALAAGQAEQHRHGDESTTRTSPSLVTFTYTSASGDVLNAGDGQNEAVTFSPDNAANFTTATGTAIVNVAKADQTITVTQTAPASAVYGTSFVVTASASSGLPVSITASGAGTVSSGGAGSATVQMISGTGTAPVTFSQAGDNNYNPATVVIENVTAQKANQTVTVTQTAPASAVYGTSFVVAASATSNLPVSITANSAPARSAAVAPARPPCK